MKVLLVDAGNSRIKWRVDDLAEDAADASEAVEAIAVADAASLGDRLSRSSRAAAAFVSCVAGPMVEAAIVAAIDRAWPGVAVQRVTASAREGPVINGYRDPTQLGIDRWLAVVGAHARLPDGALLVCTFGTATTIDLVEPTGDAGATVRFVGGLILPGFETMRRSLVDGTALLSGGHGRDVPFADNRDDAIASGLVAAQAGAVSYALEKARVRGATPRCVIAGGDAVRVGQALAASGIHPTPLPDAVMIGLVVVARRILAASTDPGGAAPAGRRS